MAKERSPRINEELDLYEEEFSHWVQTFFRNKRKKKIIFVMAERIKLSLS